MRDRNPTQVLRKEHEKVLKILDELEESTEKRDLNNSSKNIAVLEKEFEKHSLNKEEKALFPEFEKFVPREGGPTGVMILEHQELVESIKNFKDAIKLNDPKKLNEIGSHIISLLRQHIDKENAMLFTMAEMHLNSKQKEFILKKFKKIDSGKR
ncbi:MAG: hemerythrin domain-containing protein [Candidatus Diapherotrites archaeon]